MFSGKGSYHDMHATAQTAEECPKLHGNQHVRLEMFIVEDAWFYLPQYHLHCHVWVTVKCQPAPVVQGKAVSNQSACNVHLLGTCFTTVSAKMLEPANCMHLLLLFVFPVLLQRVLSNHKGEVVAHSAM